MHAAVQHSTRSNIETQSPDVSALKPSEYTTAFSRRWDFAPSGLSLVPRCTRGGRKTMSKETARGGGGVGKG